MLKRVEPSYSEPPHDIEVEQAILAKILIDNASMDAFARITPADFYDPVHQALFEAMADQWADKRAINLGTLKAVLANLQNITPTVTPIEYIRRLTTYGDTRNIADLAVTLLELSNRRRLVDTAARLDAAARQRGVKVTDAANLAVSALDEVLSHARPGRPTRSTLADAFRETIDALINDDGSERISTGLSDLDDALGGWRRKQYAIIAGRPSMGKTAVATSAMLRTAMSGVGVLYFSLEMPTTALAARCLSDFAWSPDSQVPYAAMLANNLTDHQHRLLGEVAAHWATLPVTIDDQRGLSMAEIAARTRAEAQRLEREGKTLGLVIIDHLGLVRPSGRYAGNKVQETGEISDALATLAKDQNVAVVALHQLNRGTEGRDNKRPTLADLRNSGDLEQDADVVCFCYREAYYLERMKYDAGSQQELQRQAELDACRNTLEILIAKNRNGPTKAVTLFCDMASNVIRDLARERI